MSVCVCVCVVSSPRPVWTVYVWPRVCWWAPAAAACCGCWSAPASAVQTWSILQEWGHKTHLRSDSVEHSQAALSDTVHDSGDDLELQNIPTTFTFTDLQQLQGLCSDLCVVRVSPSGDQYYKNLWQFNVYISCECENFGLWLWLTLYTVFGVRIIWESVDWRPLSQRLWLLCKTNNI